MNKFILTEEKMKVLRDKFPLEKCHGGWVGTQSPILRENIQRSIEIEGARPGFTYQDLWEFLPETIEEYILVQNKFSGITYWNPIDNKILVNFKTPEGLLEDSWKMCMWLIENKYL